MAADYQIPFGLDASQFFAGLNKMDAGVDQLGANVTQAGKDMQKAFEAPGVAVEQLGKKIDMDKVKALQLRDAAKIVGKEIGTALDGKDVGKGLEDRLTKVKKIMTEAAKPTKWSIDVDASKLMQFEAALISGKNEIENLTSVVDFARAKLATLSPGTAEFDELNGQLQIAEGFLKELGGAADVAEVSNKSLKTQLRALKEELAQMEQAGQEGTQEFLDMSVAAGQLEDQIGDTAARVRVLASDTKFLDAGVQAVTGLAGAFAAGQGAIALFGSESEAVNEIIQKTTGAMAVLQGIQAIAAAVNKDSALSVLFLSRARVQDTAAAVAQTAATSAEAAATGTATVATRAFTAALLTNPIFLAIAALVALASALYFLKVGTEDAETATEKLNKSIERQNLLLKLDEAGVKRRTDLLVAEAKRRGATESQITGIEAQAQADRLNIRRTALQETEALLNDRNYTEKLSAEEFKKLQDRALEQTGDVLDAENELRVKGIEQQTQRNKEGIEADKKREEAEKKNLEDAKKRAAERKAILDQEIKFRREYAAAYAAGIYDTYEQEKEQARQSINQKIEDLRAETALSKTAMEERDATIAQLSRNLGQTLRDIDKRRDADTAALRFEGQQKLAELMKDGVGKELEVMQLGYQARAQEIETQFKNEKDLRDRLLLALKKEQALTEKEINDRYGLQSLKEQEERAVLEVETAAQFIGKSEEVEEAKQVAILETKLKYARANLELLIKQGNAEGSVVALQAKKTIQDLEEALGGAIDAQKDNGFSLFDALGLGGLTDDEKRRVSQAANEALAQVSEITGFIADQFQRQIDKKQEIIDQENKQIADLEKQLEDEKDLRDEGLANNVETIQAEIDAKKAARDEEIKQQEDLQKKQMAIQKAQFALDTATQASSLITSAANIFKSLSSIPFVGVPLAIATIALMAGGFAAAKVKAFQAIQDGNKQSFGGGGWIDGESHARGGKKYQALDGSGDVVELEGGEHVTNKTAAAKYGDLLDALNTGDITRMKEEALRDMFTEMGIHFSEDEPGDAVQIYRETEVLKSTADAAPAGDIREDVKSINRGVTYLAEDRKTGPKTWIQDGYQYTKQGSKTTRVKI